MVEKKLYLISCLFLLSISLLNWYLKSNISWIIFFISIVTLYISLKYKLKYKQINTDSPTGMWLIEYGIGFNIFEIIFNTKSTLLGSIFIVLGLLFVLESAVLEKRRKISDKGF